MTFADSVLHLVRAGARIDPSDRRDAADSPDMELVADAARSTDDIDATEAAELHDYEPGLADLEAAVGLVAGGMASRVVLSGFPSWPGLLWRAYQLADTNGVLILPTLARGTTVRPGGRVDIVIMRETAANG